MAKPKVFVTRMIPEAGLAMVREFCDADIWPGDLPPERAYVLEHVQGVDGILSLLTTKMDPAVMDAAGPELKVISNYAVGFDNIDIPEATRRGIPVGHTPGVLTETTHDFAFALLISAARRVVEGHNYTLAGKWKTWGPSLLLGQDVYGATLGLVGFGRIGKSMAKRATGFDMKILYHDEFVPADDPFAVEVGARAVDMDTLLAESDFVSLHAPLLPSTHHLIDAAALAKMKSTAILVNSARGPLIDPAALYDALVNGGIAYAGLDVTDPEPIPMDSPLLTLDNIIIAPHIASASVVTRDRMAVMAANNLIAGLTGQRLPNCANPQVYG
ncbi:MAG TPA: D-glycerate dehydrogenase [Caldilineaceae bacterium]|nr:D-glycerate dehydrogenase [Caldilineaceae bacterium]